MKPTISSFQVGFCLSLIIFSALFACGKKQITSPTDSLYLSGELKNATPESQSINPDMLTEAFQYAGDISGLRSFLVVRNGYIVGEKYFGSASADSIYFVRSVTKSVVSILIGIAIDRGLILDEQQELSDILDLASMGIDEAKGRIKIKHLLTMTSGLEWSCW